MKAGSKIYSIRAAVVAVLATLGLAAALLLPTTTAAQEGARLRVWHFAEGLTRADIQSYFLVHNLQGRPTSVRAEYQREDGIKLTQNFGVPPRGRVSIGAGDLLGPTAFGVSFYADGDVVVERSTLAGADNDGLGQDGLGSLGFAPTDLRTWHFADGNNYGDTRTYYILRNLTDEPAAVRATFVTDIGGIQELPISLGPRSRFALGTRDLLPNRAFGVTFESNRDIVAERSVFFEGPVSPLGGLGQPGGRSGATTWYFAEGNTRRPYWTFLVVFNPGPERVSVDVQLDSEQGQTARSRLELAGFERRAYDLAALLPAATFATTVRASGPIVAERSYYSTGDGLFGVVGHSPGPPSDAKNWTFTDGNTTGRVETYFIVRNLTRTGGKVDVAFYTGDGPPTRRTLPIGPYARDVFRASDIVPNRTFATHFSADVDLVVERTMYFPGWGAHGVVGVGVDGAPGSSPAGP